MSFGTAQGHPVVQLSSHEDDAEHRKHNGCPCVGHIIILLGEICTGGMNASDDSHLVSSVLS